MLEGEILVVVGERAPAQHAAAVAVDDVPADLGHEAADIAEAVDPVELGHADRHLVAAELADLGAACLVGEVGLAAAGAHLGVPLQLAHQAFEVARRQVEVHVQLADVVEVVHLQVGEPLVEGIDHAAADLAEAAVVPLDHLQVGDLGLVGLQDLGRAVGRAVVDHDPECRRNALPHHAVERAGQILLFVPAGRDQGVAASGLRGPGLRGPSLRSHGPLPVVNSAWRKAVPAASRRACRDR